MDRSQSDGTSIQDHSSAPAYSSMKRVSPTEAAHSFEQLHSSAGTQHSHLDTTMAAPKPTVLITGCSSVAETVVLLNPEIDEVVEKSKLKPALDKGAVVNIVTWGSNWATYDDEETMKMKADFGRSQCLRSVMVWAVSHDTSYGNYSRALGKWLFAKEKYIEQCRWTGSDESSPNKWIRMMRTDNKAGKEEYMTDGAGCDGYGKHFAALPTQGRQDVDGILIKNESARHEKDWQQQRMLPQSQRCALLPNVKTYQVACCTTDETTMELYGQCSSAGSGQATCGNWNLLSGAYDNPDLYRGKYGCDQNEYKKWSEGEWHSSLSLSSELTEFQLSI
ncbi:hypothetical protein HJFPF1_08431 [Paramyrothecium foliicola]|nr:hypothetical protein HJFPF1_08431 [Paramyrothecium foliicola]